jgi:oligopeptide transport system substrate-binding protein
MKLSIRIVKLFVLTLSLITLSSCFKRETAVQRANKDNILLAGLGYEVTTLDPQLATGTTEEEVITALFEGLVSEDPVDLHPVPGVASSWKVSPDLKTYTFTLREDAHWSDGKAITASDFLNSWKRILSPELGSENANLLYVLQGAEAYNKGLNKAFNQVGVEVLDAHTLRVTLERPTPYFLALLTHWAWFPVPEIAQGLTERTSPWTKPATFVGNGPFLLKAWAPNHIIIVNKAETYWDKSHVALNAIKFFPLDSADAQERAFRSGQLHVTDTLSAGKIDVYKGGPYLRTDPYLGTSFYRINTKRPYLSDPRIRRALALAVDRKKITDKILRGGQIPAGSFTPQGINAYTPPQLLNTNIEEAKRLLREAGYPEGKGLPSFDILYDDTFSKRIIAESIQGMWKSELGIDTRLINEDVKSSQTDRKTGNYQILVSVWIADYEDPTSFLNLWLSTSSNNFTGWSNADYDAALFAAAQKSELNERSVLLTQAETILLKDTPIIPLYFYTHVFLLQPSVKGWHSNLLDHHPYKAVTLSPASESGL